MARKKKSAPFDWTVAEFDQFLLKIAYVGTPYYGLAWQTARSCSSFFEDAEVSKKRRRVGAPTSENVTLPDWYPTGEKSGLESRYVLPTGLDSDGPTLPTVEKSVVEALMRANLIKNRDECNFSRCGRTDKGVHARANYLSMKLRLKPRRQHAEDHYDYAAMLNAMLPRTIRVLGVQRVPIWFDARFHCLNRAYKYFFTVDDNIDVKEMALAASVFLGEHDFRNFCKIDPDAHKTFRRRVLQCDVEVQSDGIGVLNVVGPAFLWHQVRCMVGVLFLVGRGQLDIASISKWLDIDQTPVKPAYLMAPPDGLVLWECVFENIDTTSPDTRGIVQITKMRQEVAVHQAVLKCLETGTMTCSIENDSSRL